ncbi:MAG: endo alpha-1,4 polygalactosaminidase [Hyphomicrobiaceae bacterium]
MDRQTAGMRMLGSKMAVNTFCFVMLLSIGAQASEPSSIIDVGALKSWGYQLQRLDVQQAARMPHDLLVVDYSKDGTEAGALTWSEVSQLKQKPDGSRRVVLAYMSIGEAENYRYYWKPSWKKKPPQWLGRENKQWPGNFLAKYWMPQWQRIILGEEAGYLSRIIGGGFDGVYLDRIDAYSDWLSSRKGSRRQMIEFVIKLSRLAKHRKREFLVFAQNAEELLSDSRYIEHIDGIAKEDMLFGVSHKVEPNSKSLRSSHIKYLNLARKKDKPVLVVEYLPSHFSEISKAVKAIRHLNFVPYISERQLNVLLPPPK